MFDRDYTQLTERELEKWKLVKEKSKFTKDGKELIFGRRNLPFDLPKAVRHYNSLFPNNYLDFVNLKNVEELNSEIDEFEKLLDDKSTGENQILAFINSSSYHIIASVMRYFNFGHHNSFLFKEFPLGVSYRSDYLLVGKGSGGYQFIFIELESNKGRITIQDGNFGEAIRKGFNQINEWKRWLPGHYISLKEVYDKVRNKSLMLPEEFYEFDPTRMHMLL